MSFWSIKRVLVTGGAGFLGSFVLEKLQERGAKEIFVPRSRDDDLVEMDARRTEPSSGLPIVKVKT